MANKIIQATALPTGEQGQIILIDNGDGTFTQTVAFDRDTYPSRAADIVAGNPLLPGGLIAPFQPLIANATVVPINQGNVASGNVDLYTAPADKRALVGTAFGMNPTIGGITVFTQVKISGNYFRLSGNVTIGANGSSVLQASQVSRYVIEPGESWSINTTALGLNVFGRVMEFPSTISLKSPRLNSLALGNNTLYTCPAGKVALLFRDDSNHPIDESGVVTMVNQTIGVRTYITHLVPSGGTPGATNQLAESLTAAANALLRLGRPMALSAGEFLNVNADSGVATQSAFVTLYEL